MGGLFSKHSIVFQPGFLRPNCDHDKHLFLSAAHLAAAVSRPKVQCGRRGTCPEHGRDDSGAADCFLTSTTDSDRRHSDWSEHFTSDKRETTTTRSSTSINAKDLAKVATLYVIGEAQNHVNQTAISTASLLHLR